MNLRIVFKFKDYKLQFHAKRRLFSYFIVNPRTPASRWRRLLKLKRININSFKIIIGFFFTPPLFLATKVAISFVYCSPKTINALKSLKSKKSLQESTNRASERVPFSTSYLQLALAHARNSRVKNDINTESCCWCFTCAQLIQIKYIKSITDSKLCFLNSLSL